MKQALTALLLCLLSLTAQAQTVINVQIEQYPPLKATATTVEAELAANGITLGSDLVVEGGSGTYTYTWTNNSGTVLGSEKTLLVNATGDYFLKVADSKDCQVTVAFKVTASTGIEGLAEAEGLRQIRITNEAGMLLRTIKVKAIDKEVDLREQGLLPGAYIVSFIYADGKAQVRKVIIK